MTSLCGQFHTHMLFKNPIKIISDVDKITQEKYCHLCLSKAADISTFLAFNQPSTVPAKAMNIMYTDCSVCINRMYA